MARPILYHNALFDLLHNEQIDEPLAKLPTSIRGKLTQASEKPFFLVGNSILVPLSANLVVFVKIRAHLSQHAIKSSLLKPL